jgi:hypothetical protein
MARTALSARLYRWQSRVSSLGRFGGASNEVATKKYQVLILTPEGHILDQHTLKCALRLRIARRLANLFVLSRLYILMIGFRGNC